MSVTTVNAAMPQVEERVQPDGLWLRDRNWDTLFMTMSVFLVARPLPDFLPPLVLPSNLHVEFLQAIPIFDPERAYSHATEPMRS